MAAIAETSPPDQIGVVPTVSIPVASAVPANLRAKYDLEKEKRLRQDGVKQYINPARSEKFKRFVEDPFVETGAVVNKPVADDGHSKFLIIGAGYGGILFAVKLIKAGYSVDDLVFVDPAGGFGGTWYWNRYPGLMCDVESYIYMPMLEEMGYMPQRKYASGEELRLYIESICRKYDLYKRAMFQTSVKQSTWNAQTKEWETEIVLQPKGGAETPYKIRSDYVLLATGVLNTSKLPDLEGSDTFKGESFHTSRWRYDITGGSSADPQLTKLRGKKVGIIGTGATAIQVVPELAKWADNLIVFQRTPSSVDIRDNRDTDPEEWKTKIATKPGWQRERNDNFNSHVNNANPKPEVDLVNDGWTHAPSYSALIGGPYEDFTTEKMDDHVEMLHKLDYPRQERVRQRVGQIVQDGQTVESLQAWYPTWCKRPCFHDDYLKTFNLPNVQLVDTQGRGVDRIVPEGIVFDGKTYDIDVLVWSTGFSTSGSPAGCANIIVTGKDGKDYEHEFENHLTTLHGVCSRDFPNLFWPGPRQGGVTANQSFVLDNLTTHVAHMIAVGERRVKGKAVIEPSAAAQEEWTQICVSRAALFAAVGGCTPSYLNFEGQGARMSQDEISKMVRGSVWGRGITSYLQHIEAWRSDNRLEGLEVNAA